MKNFIYNVIIKSRDQRYKELQRSAETTDCELADHDRHWRNLIRLHSKLKRQELATNERLERQANTKSFCKNPYDFIKENVTDKGKNNVVTPNCSSDEGNTFFKERYTDSERSRSISFPYFLPDPLPPTHDFPSCEPSDDEIAEYVKSRRNKSAPGPDGIPFKIFKLCTIIMKVLFSVVRIVFKMQLIPQNDRVAIKVLIPKCNSRHLEEFRDLTLFNTSLKTVMGVWARRVRRFMLQNRYFNVNIQKGFLPKISGCVEHNQTVIDLLRNKVRSGENAFVVWMDLQNAFGSIRHNLMYAALKFYGIPD